MTVLLPEPLLRCSQEEASPGNISQAPVQDPARHRRKAPVLQESGVKSTPLWANSLTVRLQN